MDGGKECRIEGGWLMCIINSLGFAQSMQLEIF